MDKLKLIKEHKEQIARLEKELVADRRKKLVNLHKDLGYSSRKDLIDDLSSLRGGGAGVGRAKRVTITPELRSKIESELRAKKGATAVAREVGVSVPTVQNIKKDIGLVQSR